MIDHEEYMDDADKAWIDTFIGKSIPEGSVVEGFVTVISWADPETADRHWRVYDTINGPASLTIGLLEMAKHTYLAGTRPVEPEEDDL